MNVKVKFGSIALVTVLAVAPAFGQTLDQRDKIARSKVAVAQYANRVNAACGTHIQFSIDYQSYVNSPNGLGGATNNTPSGLIQNAGDAIMNICVTEAGKADVAQKIHEVHLVYTAGEEESLAGGVFTYKLDKGGSVDAPEKWLKAHL